MVLNETSDETITFYLSANEIIAKEQSVYIHVYIIIAHYLLIVVCKTLINISFAVETAAYHAYICVTAPWIRICSGSKDNVE